MKRLFLSLFLFAAIALAQQCPQGYTLTAGKCVQNAGGGGSMPTATAGGQIPTSTAAGTTYAVSPYISVDPTTGNLASLTGAVIGNNTVAESGIAIGGFFATSANGTNDVTLYEAVSKDGGKTAAYVHPTGFASGGGGIGGVGPVLVLGGRQWWSTSANTCWIFSSDDMQNFSSPTQINITGTNPMGTFCYAPYFWQDPANKALIHLYYSSGNNTATAMSLYHVQATYNFSTQAFGSWGDHTGTANSADLMLSVGGSALIDPNMFQVGSNYILGYTQYLPASNGVQYATCTSPYSGCSVTSSGNWTAQLPASTCPSEGSIVSQWGSKVRMYVDQVSPVFGTTCSFPAGTTYLETSTYPGGTWSAPVTVLPNANITTAGDGNLIGRLRHGAFVPVFDTETVRTALNLVAYDAKYAPRCIGTYGSLSSPCALVTGVTTSYFTAPISGTSMALSTPLPVTSGGTGTASPGLVSGANVTITGAWPNQTITAAGGGGGGVSAVNPACTFATSGTGCSINVAGLLVANANYSSIVAQCFTGASTTQTPISITSYTYATGATYLATVTPSFSAAAAAGYCTANLTTGPSYSATWPAVISGTTVSCPSCSAKLSEVIIGTTTSPTTDPSGTVATFTTSSVVFSAIPQGFTHLKLSFAATTAGSDQIGLQFNGDTSTSDYDAMHAVWFNSATQGVNNWPGLAYFKLTEAFAPGPWGPVQGELRIKAYSGAVLNKYITGEFSSSSPSVANPGIIRTNVDGSWQLTAAITSIRIFTVSGAAFSNGSTFTISAEP